MAHEVTRPNQQLITFEHDFIVEDFAKFANDGFDSQIVYIDGKPWMFAFNKNMPRLVNDGKLQLAVYLQALTNERKIWADYATTSVKIYSSRFDHEGGIFKLLFAGKLLGWTDQSFIEWDKFIDPAYGYVNNNTCKFQVRIERDRFYGIRDVAWEGYVLHMFNYKRYVMRFEGVPRVVEITQEKELVRTETLQCWGCSANIRGQQISLAVCGHMYCFNCMRGCIHETPCCTTSINQYPMHYGYLKYPQPEKHGMIEF